MPYGDNYSIMPIPNSSKYSLEVRTRDRFRKLRKRQVRVSSKTEGRKLAMSMLSSTGNDSSDFANVNIEKLIPDFFYS